MTDNPLHSSRRHQTYRLLNPDSHDDRLSRGVNYFLVVLILMNLLAVSLQTEPSIDTRYATWFFLFEVFSVIVFTGVFLLRFWSATESHPSRKAFVLSFDSVIDIVSVMPFYLSLIYGIDMRMLIVLRLLRLLKLIRYFSPLALLAQVIKAEARAFVAAIFILLILIFIASTGIYFFENDAQPENFGSIPRAMWWATVTLTTLGYGDIVPITVAGKFFAALITILSIGTVALPAGMLASRFSDELHKRKEDYSNLVNTLTVDGSLNSEDKQTLEGARIGLCLSETDAEQLESLAPSLQGESCPHCLGSGRMQTGN